MKNAVEKKNKKIKKKLLPKKKCGDFGGGKNRGKNRGKKLWKKLWKISREKKMKYFLEKTKKKIQPIGGIL
jgi:hypothetical protein